MGCGGLLGVNAGSVVEPRMIVIRYVPADRADRAPRPRRQGHHLRLRRHQPQAVERDARGDEDGHERCRCGARGDDGARGPRGPGRGQRLPGLHGQHAVGLGHQARRRADQPGAAARSRWSTPTPRVAWSWSTRSRWRCEDGVDAIVDIATLTGAALAALGMLTAAVIGNDDTLARPGRGRRRAAPTSRSGGCRWTAGTASSWTPRSRTSRTSAASSPGRSPRRCSWPSGWATTPWAHLDIAGPMRSDADDAWRTKGATGFGAAAAAGGRVDVRRETGERARARSTSRSRGLPSWAPSRSSGASPPSRACCCSTAPSSCSASCSRPCRSWRRAPRPRSPTDAVPVRQGGRHAPGHRGPGRGAAGHPDLRRGATPSRSSRPAGPTSSRAPSSRTG